MKSRIAFAAAMCAAAVVAEPSSPESFWRVSQDSNGVWWAISPVSRAADSSAAEEGGKATFLRGIDHVSWRGHWCEALGVYPYGENNAIRFGGDQGAWRDETLSRLRDWGFNMLGAGCSRELENQGLAHTVQLEMGQRFCQLGADHELSHFKGVPGTAFPNVRHPDWPKFCDERAAKLCAAQRDNPHLFGYFFDNELNWRGRSREEASLYFSTIAAAVRRHDPNHMVLGCRFAGMGGDRIVWEEAGKSCDALTFNRYPWADIDNGVVYMGRNSTNLFADAAAERHAWCGRPMLITEWSFPALDAGLPCSNGAGQRFHTQAQRTQATELMARTLLSLPFMVGYDYFMWVDEPALGISFNFPEDSNYGLVNEKGEPYREITEMFARVNHEAETLHAKGKLEHLDNLEHLGHLEKLDNLEKLACQRAPAEFSRSGDAYTLRVPGGLTLSGRIGGKFMIGSITMDGIGYGPFTAMLYHGKWQDCDRVTAAEWDAERGALRISGEGRDGDKAFRITCDITPCAMRGAFLCSVVSVENIGTATLERCVVYLRQYAPWASDKLSVECRFPINVWKQPDSDCWMRVSDGAWCGAATTSPLIKDFHYWLTGDKAAHPDASFAPSGGITLAPGESYDPQGKIWYVAGHGTGGRDGWRGFLDQFAK